MRKFVLPCALLLTLLASDASAQMIKNMAKRAGVGGSIGTLVMLDDDVEVAAPVWGFNFGLAPEPGLGPTMGFGWFEGDLTVPRVSGTTEVGTLRVRPLMAGIAYTWVKGRMATGVSLNAGISFNSIRLNDQYRNFFGAGTEVTVDSSDSFCVRPQLRFEYAVAPKVGLFTSLGYFFTEFDNVINTPVGRFENEWDASSFNVFAGVMIYPFK
jgi:hypothetical protein